MEKQAQVLVVDDEAVWRNKLAKILEDKGYLVCKAATYRGAMRWLKGRGFHLAVIDVNLADAPVDKRGEPEDISGMNIIAKIRERAIEQDMSVIIVTGFGTARLTREAFKKLDVFDVILKQDFDLEEFRSLVSDAIALALYKTPGENL